MMDLRTSSDSFQKESRMKFLDSKQLIAIEIHSFIERSAELPKKRAFEGIKLLKPISKRYDLNKRSFTQGMGVSQLPPIHPGNRRVLNHA